MNIQVKQSTFFKAHRGLSGTALASTNIKIIMLGRLMILNIGIDLNKVLILGQWFYDISTTLNAIIQGDHMATLLDIFIDSDLPLNEHIECIQQSLEKSYQKKKGISAKCLFTSSSGMDFCNISDKCEQLFMKKVVQTTIRDARYDIDTS